VTCLTRVESDHKTHKLDVKRGIQFRERMNTIYRKTTYRRSRWGA